MADTPKVPAEVYDAAALAYELRGDPERRILYDTDTGYAWHLDYDAHATSQERPFRAAVDSVFAAGVAAGLQQAIEIAEAAFAAARALPRPPSTAVALDAGHRKVPGVALDHASRAWRITAIGLLLEQLVAAGHAQAVGAYGALIDAAEADRG